MWLQQRALVADVSASLHVQMCNTCWQEQKEFLLCLLSIPHETSLAEPASRLAPSLRHTALYWRLKFCSGRAKYIFPDALQPWAMIHLLMIGVICHGLLNTPQFTFCRIRQLLDLWSGVVRGRSKAWCVGANAFWVEKIRLGCHWRVWLFAALRPHDTADNLLK